MKPDCPSGVGYSTSLWAYAAGRYFVEKSSTLIAEITIQWNSERDGVFTRPQVWFTSPDPEEGITSPPFQYTYSTERVPALGEEFVLKLEVDTRLVPAHMDVMGFRPQIDSMGYTYPLDTIAPITGFKFQCLNAQAQFKYCAPGEPRV